MKMTNWLTALIVAAGVGNPAQGGGEANAASAVTSTQNYTVAIYYWPNFHRDAYHQSKKGEGWTEWEIVKNGKPKFEGHYQPKVPLWGYRDESDPKEMARSIDAMADAGIGAIIFDWYRYDDDINGGVMIEEALKRGFLQATNRNRIKFALMWANHTYIDCHPFAPGISFHNAPVWRKGEVGRAAFDRHTQDAIESYFKQPNYWKIDGRPYFSIYVLDKLIAGLGGLAETRTALDDFRARVKAAGFPDLHLNIVDQGESLKQVLESGSRPAVPERSLAKSGNRARPAGGAQSRQCHDVYLGASPLAHVGQAARAVGRKGAVQRERHAFGIRRRHGRPRKSRRTAVARRRDAGGDALGWRSPGRPDRGRLRTVRPSGDAAPGRAAGGAGRSLFSARLDGLGRIASQLLHGSCAQQHSGEMGGVPQRNQEMARPASGEPRNRDVEFVERVGRGQLYRARHNPWPEIPRSCP